MAVGDTVRCIYEKDLVGAIVKIEGDMVSVQVPGRMLADVRGAWELRKVSK